MIVLFDLNGTLTDPAGIGEPWQDRALGSRALELAVQSAMTDTILGDYRPFADHLRSALGVLVAEAAPVPGPIDDAMERAARLAAWPDAAPALDRLAEHGHRLAVLTNSGAESGRATLDAAGLADRFEQILGVDAVERFKPHPATYRHAIGSLGARAQDVLLVAAHAWDVWGAKRAGLRTAWIARGERAFPSAAPDPDLRAADLADAAEQILGLAASGR